MPSSAPTPPKTSSPQPPGSQSWDDEADVIVVGFGGAGVSAALEAVDKGADTLVLERYAGGGATRMSGGVFYGGGGTPYQKEAGFEDTPDNMFNYLTQETRGVVKDETLRRFCDESPANLQFLEDNGIVFGPNFCSFKTSYPIDKYNLYYSGNESFLPYTQTSEPAPRGHKPIGNGMGGRDFYDPLRESAIEKGVRINCQSKVTRVLTGADGSTVGVEAAVIPEGSFWARFHSFVSAFEYNTRYVTLGFPPFRYIILFFYALAERFAVTKRIRAKTGVILSSGGFIYNRQMLKEHAPRFLAGIPLGSQGDDGSGIQLGRQAGGATDLMDNVSFWRFINPPEAFPKGILVNRKGKRICNEQYYGAKAGELMCNEENATQGILIIDTKLWREAHRGLLPDRAKWFQSMLTLLFLYTGKRASCVGKLGKHFGIPVDTLMETIEDYNALARNNGEGDPMGKMPAFFHELKPPFVGINVSLDAFAGATLTLGGLVVNEESGEVQREDGSEIHGLYAAGRTAVGVSSSGYVSGLSIADCVFSGRRAANHASHKIMVESASA